MMKSRYYIALFVVLVVLYLGLTFLIAPNKAILAEYHVTSTYFRVITFSVVIPLIAIWTAGLYGSLKMKGYSLLVKDSPDGPPLYSISIGLLILVFSSPISSNLNAIVAQIVKHNPATLSTLTIINNYIAILMMGTGLYFVALGAGNLVGLVKRRSISPKQQHIWVGSFIALTSVYSYLIIRPMSHAHSAAQIYFMPDILVLLTIAIPYLYFWYRGLNAAYDIYTYQKSIKGKLYKSGLIYVAGGIAMVIISSIFVRFITTVSYTLTRLHLTPLLFIVYAFLIITGLSYVSIAWGAKKLRQIEEV